MLDVPTLDSLDLMLWLQSGVEAARLSACVPSTIVRRVDQALKTFDLKLRRSRSGWTLRGNLQLISLEREIHQLYRFQGGGRLRLHLPAWTQRLLGPELPATWLCPPAGDGPPCGDPLSLLRQRVIDACVLTPTQLAATAEGRADDLICFELYSSRILLYGHSGDPSEPPPQDVLDACRQGLMNLEVPAFLPLPCQEMVRQRFVSLTGRLPGVVPSRSQRRQPSWGVTFLTPEMAGLVPALQPLADPFEWSYSERLVVLRDHAQRPAILAIREALHEALGQRGLAEPAAA